MIKLYGYWRSSAAYRVRIALNLKGLPYETVSINLAKGEHGHGDYAQINPQGLVPVLEVDGDRLFQSLAIIEYLEEKHPEPTLLPRDAGGRARVRSLALIVACEIHPLNNPRVLNYLTGTFAISDEQRLTWYHHWIKTGFSALEKRLATETGAGSFCHGDSPTMADIALVPQVANAVRFNVNLSTYPNIRRINDACQKLEAFQKAAPQNQPDAQ
ncbi:MAG: maleylacetoacetate isomerase [Proteobacteria bacterium]|nr:MAG: maleylacetoacetate isomerase [Pseudomonadota bacterium]